MGEPAVDGVREGAILDLCGRLFREPHRLFNAARLTDATALRSPPHAHDIVLQLDLIVRCDGTVMVGDDRRAVADTAAVAFLPGVNHCHQLTKRGAESEVLSVKLTVDPSWPLMTSQVLPPYIADPEEGPVLRRAMRRLAALMATGRGRALPGMIVVAEILAAWPSLAGRSSALASDPSGLDSVLKLVDRSLHRPPSIAEMSSAAGRSRRQFIRHFTAVMGHQYVTQRRLARARALLAGGDMSVTEVAKTLGFPSIHAFSRWFHRETKLRPSEYRAHPLL
jgi:AraC-like DNA-binding protein